MLEKMTATMLATTLIVGSCANTFADSTDSQSVIAKNQITTVQSRWGRSGVGLTTTTTEATTETTTKAPTTTTTEATTETTTKAPTTTTTEATTETTTKASATTTTEATTTTTTETTTETTTKAPTTTTEATTESTTKELTTTTETTTKVPTEATTIELSTEATTNAKKETAATTTTETTTETTTVKHNSSSSSDDTIVRNESYNLYLDTNETNDLYNYVINLVACNEYSWSTSNSKIVSVNDEGDIEALKSGTATITAYYYNGNYYLQYIFTINVDSDSITSSKDIDIYVDGTKDLGNYVSNVVDANEYTWSTNNKSIATISSKGILSGKKKGTTTVTATYHSGKYDYKYVFDVTVKNGTSSSSSTGSTTKTAKTSWNIYMPTDKGVYLGDFLDYEYGEYKWTIDNENYASFNNGKVTGKKKGTTKITAKRNSVTYTFTLYINDDYSVKTATVRTGNTLNIDNYLDYDTDEYTFSSDRTAVATVNENGVMKGVSNGMATILAKHEDGEIIQVFLSVVNVGNTSNNTSSNVSENTSNKKDDTTTNNNTQNNATDNNSLTAVESENVFNDISHRTWAITSIENMCKKGYIVGLGDGRFEPDGTTKRADFTIVLVKMFGLEGKADGTYEDVIGNEYYADYVNTAKSNGIEGGVSENCFRPKDAITREEIFVMIYKAMSNKGIEMNTDTTVLNNYSDSSYMNDNNREAIAALINNGVVVGTGDKLEITTYITRAQMAVLLDKVDGYLK